MKVDNHGGQTRVIEALDHLINSSAGSLDAEEVLRWLITRDIMEIYTHMHTRNTYTLANLEKKNLCQWTKFMYLQVTRTNAPRR